MTVHIQSAQPGDDQWKVLLSLQHRAQQCRDTIELGFLIANDTWHLCPYSQACVFLPDALGQPALRVISGLGQALEDTPFTLWVRQVHQALASTASPTATRSFQAGDLPEALHDGWQEWWPAHALYLPLVSPSGPHQGDVLLTRDTPWLEHEISALKLLAAHHAYCLQALRGSPSAWRRGMQAFQRHPRRGLIAGAAVLAALFCPVRMSVVAPAEIIALKAEAVAAPTDGVVRTIHVQPNQPVKQGQTLFSLDDTSLRNRRAVSEQALAVARSEALAAQQKAFDNAQSRSDLASLQGKVKEKEAELSYIDEALTRIDIHAAHDGVLVYGDANDWLGKPVGTGERIAQLASPKDLGVMVWLPVADAINLEVGAPMKVYLQTAPLDALKAELVQTSYQATLSPDGTASYRIRGALPAGTNTHIGLRGVAKIYGDWRPAIYWLMRRPLGAMRQWLGI